MENSLITTIKKLVKDKGHANLDTDLADLSKEQKEYVITEIQSGAKYMLDIMPYSKHWVIKNPNYVNHFWNDVKIALLGALLTFIIGFTLWLIEKRSSNQQIQELKEQVVKLSNRLDSLQRPK